jgi:hypothetical protein
VNIWMASSSSSVTTCDAYIVFPPFNFYNICLSNSTQCILRDCAKRFWYREVSRAALLYTHVQYENVELEQKRRHVCIHRRTRGCNLRVPCHRADHLTIYSYNSTLLTAVRRTQPITSHTLNAMPVPCAQPSLWCNLPDWPNRQVVIRHLFVAPDSTERHVCLFCSPLFACLDRESRPNTTSGERRQVISFSVEHLCWKFRASYIVLPHEALG